MEPADLTIEILKGIRHELQLTRNEIGGVRDELRLTRTELSGRIDGVRTELSERIDGLRDELSSRIVASEVRTATAIVDLHGTVREMTHVLRAQHD